MVILDFYINYMYGLAEFAASTEEIYAVYQFNKTTSCHGLTHHHIQRRSSVPRM